MNPQEEILKFLDDHRIQYERMDHPPLFTCDDAEKYGLPPLPGADTKNLFLKDNKGEHLLVVTTCRKKVALNDLKRALSLKSLSFGSAEKMEEYLGVKPGAVTSLGIYFDKNNNVKLYIDKIVWDATHVQCHPCTNEATLTLPIEEYRRFINVLGVEVNVIEVPERGVNQSGV